MVRLISLSPASCPPRSSASLAPRGPTALLLRLDASFLGPSRLRHFRSLSSRHTETARSGSPAAPTSSIRFQVSDQILPSSCGSLDVLRGIAGCDWRFDACAFVSANGTVGARRNLAAPSQASLYRGLALFGFSYRQKKTPPGEWTGFSQQDGGGSGGWGAVLRISRIPLRLGSSAWPVPRLHARRAEHSQAGTLNRGGSHFARPFIPERDGCSG